MALEMNNVSNVKIISADGKVMTERDLKERVFKRCDQFDYQKFVLADYWYVRPTIVMLTSFYMEVNGMFDKGDPVETFSKIYSNYMDYIVYSGLLGGNIKYTTIVEEDEEPGGVDLDRTRFRKEDLFDYIEKNNIIRLDVDRLKQFISGDEVPVEALCNTASSNKSNAVDVQDGQQTECYSDNSVETDVKYPVYKGLEYGMLDKKTFEDIKKYYRMLQLEESKWRKAIPIASKIGLLFYERSLDKPTTRPAFLDAYKREFDGILNNDTVAKEIYSNLPDEYHGRSGKPKVTSDIDPIIKAAAFAGSMAHERDSMNIITLKKSLSIEQFVIPPDDILKKIIAAVKNLELDIED